jgi:hypothetical protein
MKKICLLILLSFMGSSVVFADYDPRDDPNSSQSRAATQRARKASAEAKVKRDAANAEAKLKQEKAQADQYRAAMKDRATGLTDEQVRAAYPAFAKAQEASAYKSAADAYRKPLGDRTKGLTDKQVLALASDPKVQKEMMAESQSKLANTQAHFANMSPADRAAFERNSGMTTEQFQRMVAQAQSGLEKSKQ